MDENGRPAVDTWDMEPSFKRSAYASGVPFIAVEVERGEDLPQLGLGFLGFDLREDMTLQEVFALVEMLNRDVTRITYTGPIGGNDGGKPGRGARARAAQGNVVPLRRPAG